MTFWISGNIGVSIELKQNTLSFRIFALHDWIPDLDCMSSFLIVSTRLFKRLRHNSWLIIRIVCWFIFIIVVWTCSLRRLLLSFSRVHFTWCDSAHFYKSASFTLSISVAWFEFFSFWKVEGSIYRLGFCLTASKA